MSLSLKLELQPNNKVIVTNSFNQESKEVTLNFVQNATRNSLDNLIQYKYYEILVNAEGVWNQVKYFDSSIEAAKEIDIERKFKNIMTPSSRIQITDCEREMYNRTLPVINTYDSRKDVAQTAKIIRKFKNFGWEIVDKTQDYITMINHGKLTTLFIPNCCEIEEKTLLKLISKAELSVIEFFMFR